MESRLESWPLGFAFQRGSAEGFAQRYSRHFLHGSAPAKSSRGPPGVRVYICIYVCIFSSLLSVNKPKTLWMTQRMRRKSPIKDTKKPYQSQKRMWSMTEKSPAQEPIYKWVLPITQKSFMHVTECVRAAFFSVLSLTQEPYEECGQWRKRALHKSL